MTPSPTFTGLLHTLHVRDLMTPRHQLTILDQHATLADLLTTLQTHHHVWITDNTSLTGIVTPTDTLTLFAPPVGDHDYDTPNTTSLAYGHTPAITDIMTTRPLTITPDDTLTTALKHMNEHHITQLAVTDTTNHLLGELTLHHLIDRYLTHHQTTTPPQTL